MILNARICFDSVFKPWWSFMQTVFLVKIFILIFNWREIRVVIAPIVIDVGLLQIWWFYSVFWLRSCLHLLTHVCEVDVFEIISAYRRPGSMVECVLTPNVLRINCNIIYYSVVNRIASSFAQDVVSLVPVFFLRGYDWWKLTVIQWSVNGTVAVFVKESCWSSKIILVLFQKCGVIE